MVFLIQIWVACPFPSWITTLPVLRLRTRRRFVSLRTCQTRLGFLQSTVVSVGVIGRFLMLDPSMGCIKTGHQVCSCTDWVHCRWPRLKNLWMSAGKTIKIPVPVYATTYNSSFEECDSFGGSGWRDLYSDDWPDVNRSTGLKAAPSILPCPYSPSNVFPNFIDEYIQVCRRFNRVTS